MKNLIVIDKSLIEEKIEKYKEERAQLLEDENSKGSYINLLTFAIQELQEILNSSINGEKIWDEARTYKANSDLTEDEVSVIVHGGMAPRKWFSYQDYLNSL